MTMKSTLHLDHSMLAVESEHRVHVMIELDAPSVVRTERPPLHLALVMDRSGSMAGAKLTAAKNAARFLVERLEPTDTFALIAFDDSVELLAASDRPSKQRLAQVISSIHPGGTTNLSGGWLKGSEELGRTDGDGTRRVLLLTDGLANVGITDPEQLTSMTTALRRTGISTTSIGFGDGFDEALLTAMADGGGGNAYYASGPDEAPAIFAAEFDGLANLAAHNVSLEIRPTEEVLLIGVLNEYPGAPVPGGVQIQLSDFYSKEKRRIVFELEIPAVADLGPKRVADLVLRYTTAVHTPQMHAVTIPLNVNMADAESAAVARINTDVIDEVLILRAAEARRKAVELAEHDRFDDAADTLHATAADLARAMASSPRSQELAEEIDELEYSGRRLRNRVYDAGERKRMHYERHRNLRSRPRRDGSRPAGQGDGS
jgi:Ca-activated chloride channel family protein